MSWKTPVSARLDLAKNRARSAGSWKNSSLLISACHCSLQVFAWPFPQKNKQIWCKACLGHKMTQIRWVMIGVCMVYKWISLHFQSPCFMYNHNFDHTLRPTQENEGHEHDMSTLLTVLICFLTAKDTSKVKVDGDQKVVSVTVMNQTCILTYIYSSACHALRMEPSALI